MKDFNKGVTTLPLRGYDHNIRGSIVHTFGGNIIEELPIKTFTLYHTSDCTKTVLNVDDYPTINLTKFVKRGCIYGGYTKTYPLEGIPYDASGVSVKVDGKTVRFFQRSLMELADGTVLAPVAGTTYYIKEVPNTYFKYDVFYGSSDVFIIAVLDDNLYDEVYINGESTFTSNSVNIPGGSKVSAESFGLSRGYVCNIHNSTEPEQISAAAYTIDGVEIPILRVGSNSDIDNNGHEYVDLGLPSGTLWATERITNSQGEIMCFYFGNVTGMTADEYNSTDPNIDKVADRYYDSDNDVYTKYNETDGLEELELTDDPAHVLWGGEWHVPNTHQIQELMEYCELNWVLDSDTHETYCVLTSGINGNSIVLHGNYICLGSNIDNTTSFEGLLIYGYYYEGFVARTQFAAVLPVIGEFSEPIDDPQ